MNKKRKNLRKGFIRLTLVLSFIAALVGAIIGMNVAPYEPPAPYPLISYIFRGFAIGFSSIWLLYFFITYVVIPVIRFVKSGFEAK